MTFTTTWICRFCGVQRSSIAGSRFVLRRGIKVRKCAECVAEGKIKNGRKTTATTGTTAAMPVLREHSASALEWGNDYQMHEP